MIAYPNFVIGRPYTESEEITPTIRTRNILSVRISKSEKKLLCIMMNPSNANSYESDQTVNRILQLLNHKQQVGIVEIVNLYPVYKTESSALYQTLREVLNTIGKENYIKLLERNNDLIVSKLNEADLTVFAWGDPPNNMPKTDYNEHARNILRYASMLQNKRFYIFETQNWEDQLTKLGHPRHPNRNNLLGFIPCNIDRAGTINLKIS